MKLPSVKTGHHDIGKDEIRRAFLQPGKGLSTRVKAAYPASGGFEHFLDYHDLVGIIIDQTNGHLPERKIPNGSRQC